MSVGFFTEIYDQYAPLSEKYEKISWNTGNILFMDSIKSIVDCEIMRDAEPDSFDKHDAFITTELIWVQELDRPTTLLMDRIKKTKDKPLIPISVGLQSKSFKPDFHLEAEMVEAFKILEERGTLGVRGFYTAEIMEKHGIKNIEVIGCPSVYQIPLYQSTLDYLLQAPRMEFVSANHRSLWGDFRPVDFHMLKYIADNCQGFIEQTLFDLPESPMLDENIRKWFQRNTHLFFDAESWIRHNQRYDFSFGLRFHANVAALVAGVRALFVTIDSRTQELTEYFKLPSVKIADFSTERPIASYVGTTSFAPFVQTFSQRLDTFHCFLGKNSLKFSPKFQERVNSWLPNR